MADEAEVVVPEEGVVEIALEGGEAPKKAAETEAKSTEKKASQERARVEPEPPSPDSEATKALQSAQATVENERRLRQAAEQTAMTATQQAEQERRARLSREQELEQTRESLAQRELSQIESGISSATKEIAATQKELSAALTAGEFEKVAEAQTRLSRASAALDRWEDKKANYEARPVSPATSEGAVAEQQPVVSADPFERYVSRMDPPAQAWLRAHREYAPASVGGRDDLNAKMMSGHYAALGQDIKANSEDYFRVIEETIGLRKPVKAALTTEESSEPKPNAKQRQVSAPPSREPPGSPSTGTNRTVRLTKEQQEAARFSFPNLEPAKAYAEYARNYVALDAEGKLGRTSH